MNAALKKRQHAFRAYLSNSASAASNRHSATESTSRSDEDPFYLYGCDFEIFVTQATATDNGTARWLGNSPSSADRLVMLHEAIAKLAALPPEHDMHIDAATRDQATVFLNLLAQQHGPLPKIFPQDGEALVFTWDVGRRKRVVTVAGDDVSGMDIDPRLRVRCDYDLPLVPPDARAEWLHKIGGGPVGSSTGEE